MCLISSPVRMFQHTAARRRLASESGSLGRAGWVSTHSRPKAAGNVRREGKYVVVVSTHSRPKAAGKAFDGFTNTFQVSTHSRPKAAGGRGGLAG